MYPRTDFDKHPGTLAYAAKTLNRLRFLDRDDWKATEEINDRRRVFFFNDRQEMIALSEAEAFRVADRLEHEERMAEKMQRIRDGAL